MLNVTPTTQPAPRRVSQHPGVPFLARLIGGDRRIARHAPMQPPSSAAKYVTVHRAPTDAQLAAHLAGRATLAAYLIDGDDLAVAGLIELDTGGAELGRAVLAELQKRGIVAFMAYTPGANGHNGAHIWAVYSERTDPAAIRAQLAAAAQAVGAPTGEIYPSGKAIRLPFGVHRHTGKRGIVELQTGERFDLDAGALDTAIAAVLALPQNAPPALPEPTPQPVPTQPADHTPNTPQAAPQGRRTAREAIAAFNAENPIDSLITRYGGQCTRDGYACNCRVAHTHDTQIVITNQGRAVFLSPRCGWAPGRTDRNGRPIGDAFDLYTQVEHHGDKAAALKAINPWHSTSPEAERKRVARAEAAATTLQAVLDRAASDEALHANRIAARVLNVLLEAADGRPWCRPSRAAIAATIERSERTVQRALSWLEGRYIRTEVQYNRDGEPWIGGPNGTPRRTFLRVPDECIVAPQTDEVRETETRETNSALSPKEHEASEGGRCEPGDLDDAGWAALLASSPPALDEYPDLAALAACEVAGLCEVPGELLPEAGQLDTTPAEQAAPPSPALAPEPAPVVDITTKTTPQHARALPEPAPLAEICTISTPQRARVSPDGVPPEAVVIADGASFTPQPEPAPDAPYTATCKDTASTEAQYAALYRLYQEHMQRAQPAADASPATDADGPMVKGPPRAAHLRTAYYALKGRARKAASRKQRMYLEGQARALEEWYTPAELAQHRAPPLARSTPAADVQADPAAYQGALWGS